MTAPADSWSAARIQTIRIINRGFEIQRMARISGGSIRQAADEVGGFARHCTRARRRLPWQPGATRPAATPGLVQTPDHDQELPIFVAQSPASILFRRMWTTHPGVWCACKFWISDLIWWRSFSYHSWQLVWTFATHEVHLEVKRFILNFYKKGMNWT
jgi:hypothetical protein